METRQFWAGGPLIRTAASLLKRTPGDRATPWVEAAAPAAERREGGVEKEEASRTVVEGEWFTLREDRADCVGHLGFVAGSLQQYQIGASASRVNGRGLGGV